MPLRSRNRGGSNEQKDKYAGPHELTVAPSREFS